MSEDSHNHNGHQKAQGAPLGPDSILWRTASDPRALLTGSAAGIMQLMLPGLGAGVSEHSNFFEDPLDRIFRSIPYIWGTIFAGDDAEGDARGREIRDMHTSIKGTDSNGNRYHALDPDIYWWAHATFTWEFFRARELYFAVPLRRGEQEQLYAETVTWYRRYGVSDRPVPPDLDAFRERFEQICRHELQLTPAVEWVLDPASNPAVEAPVAELSGPLGHLNDTVNRLGTGLRRVLVYGAMPDIVRRRFGFSWSNADRAAFAAVCTALRGSEPAIRRGALTALFPEGTPRADLRDPARVVLSGPSPLHGRRKEAAQG